MEPKRAESKTEVIRRVILAKGFTTKNPPPGWKAEVEAALAAEGVTANESMYYRIQKRLSGRRVSRPRGKVKVENGKAVSADPRPAADPIASKAITFDQLRRVRDLAREVGGLAVIMEACRCLEGSEAG